MSEHLKNQNSQPNLIETLFQSMRTPSSPLHLEMMKKAIEEILKLKESPSTLPESTEAPQN